MAGPPSLARPFTISTFIALLAIGAAAPGRAQIVSPVPGGTLPPSYFDRVNSDPSAFQFRNAWIQKAERAKKRRDEFDRVSALRGSQSAGQTPASASATVAGNLYVPVLLAKFSNTGAAPFPSSDLQRELFDGPWPTGTLTELYREMSNGNVNVTGQVYDWVNLAHADTYYEGGCNGLCGTSKTGELILEVLTASDPAIDFGQYDNDGPDGVPNSGDDDGYVDFISLVHPEVGGECLSGNIWSHRWVVQAWPEFSGPWMTNDARTGGGYIKIQDYTIQPALGCSGSMIEIGVYAHEFGHGFGLPDLYDTDGGGVGIGHHGLMGTGNWNTPSNPAHMSPWSKIELGWITPTNVGPIEQTYVIDNINETGQVYRLNVFEERFRRKPTTAIDGDYALHCGLTATEASNRNWPNGAGYGNGWYESIRHDFSYDGTSPVTLRYDIRYDMQLAFDFVRVQIHVGGSVSDLRTYTSAGFDRNETVDLTPFLAGSGASSYKIVVVFQSGKSKSDEDGDFDSGDGGPLILDNISVTGGGENYYTDFETSEDGWYTDIVENPPSEYFLLENRSKRASFDQALLYEGIHIWHIEEDVAWSRLGNTGGTSATTNQRPVGVRLVEADDLNHLLGGQNSGDSGDAFPGTSNRRTFDDQSAPNSHSYNGLPSNIRVANISDPGPQMTALMRAGRPEPAISSIQPLEGEQNSRVDFTSVSGANFVYGATLLLRDTAASEFPAETTWIGKNTLSASIDLSGVPVGSYDVVVRNPDGQEALLSSGFTVNNPVPVFIQQFAARHIAGAVEVFWDIWADESIDGFRLFRLDGSSQGAVTGDGIRLDADTRRFVDSDVNPGQTYQYVLAVIETDGGQTISQSVTVTLPGAVLALEQNRPNPFNPSTVIAYSVPQKGHAVIDVFDARGRRVKRLLDATIAAGRHEVLWNGTDARDQPVASGVYFYRLDAGGKPIIRKMLLLQ